jgi:hypothetical protein
MRMRGIKSDDRGAISRRGLLGGAGVGAGVLALAGLTAPRSGVAWSAPAARLKGIGLTVVEFDDLYVPAGVGQGAAIYRAGADEFYVAMTSGIKPDRVVSVFWGADTPEAGLPLADAQKRLGQFLPDDAALVETGDAPGAGIGPRVRVDVYQSPALASAMRGSGFVDSGNALLVFLYTPDLSGSVVSANLYVPAKPAAT